MTIRAFFANAAIMDTDSEMSIPVEGSAILTENPIGANLANCNSIATLRPFACKHVSFSMNCCVAGDDC